ncbi:MAG TPA: GNAT family protein [Ktedonobacteraceae bacterium]|nr:GNAT family protein [Ktedonobacteraceae bacterium]
MFSLNGVTLRPLELDDIDLMYQWEANIELDILSGWTPKRSLATFRQKFEKRITEPEDDRYTFGIQFEGRLVGYVELVMIDHFERRTFISILIGDKQLWGRGIGSTALRILLDYAFTVQAMEKICAEVYGLNPRSQRPMERVGFQREGILRQHEFHNGSRQDMHVFGILKPEFYQRYETIFRLPDENTQS